MIQKILTFCEPFDLPEEKEALLLDVLDFIIDEHDQQWIEAYQECIEKTGEPPKAIFCIGKN